MGSFGKRFQGQSFFDSTSCIVDRDLLRVYWTLGEKESAHNHLAQVFEMDESFKEAARHDKDLVGNEW